MRADAFSFGLWQFRAGTGNFAWAGIDMALADICGQAAGQPLWRLLGGAVRSDVTLLLLPRARRRRRAARAGRGGPRRPATTSSTSRSGWTTRDDLRMVATLREALGAGPRLRLDVNSNWSVPQALRMLERLAEYDIDFVEQPVRETPLGQLGELRRALPDRRVLERGPLVGGRRLRAHPRARGRRVTASRPPGSARSAAFSRLAYLAELEGLKICKHTHGELGIAAAACQHVLLTMPNGVDGHQQTAQMMVHDVLSEELPIAHGPHWGRIDAPGLGVEVDPDAVAEAAGRYRSEGQYLPWQPYQLGREDAP